MRDPHSHQLLCERRWRWWTVVRGRHDAMDERGIEPTPRCWWLWTSGEMISHRDYVLMLEQAGWADQWAPESAEANPEKPTDYMQEPIPF